MNIEKTVKNLELRGFAVKRFATGAQAAEYLKGVCAGQTVGFGGSKTLDQIGIFDMLPEGTAFWHWRVPGNETYDKAAHADLYLSGANAITEGGEIVSVDGRGNRIANQVFGHKKVFIVTSVSKIVEDLNAAIDRSRGTAAVENGKRFPNNVPCKTDGKCHDCRSPERLCRAMTVLWAPMMGMEAEVVLIDEKLGF